MAGEELSRPGIDALRRPPRGLGGRLVQQHDELVAADGEAPAAERVRRQHVVPDDGVEGHEAEGREQPGSLRPGGRNAGRQEDEQAAADRRQLGRADLAAQAWSGCRLCHPYDRTR